LQKKPRDSGTGLSNQCLAKPLQGRSDGPAYRDSPQYQPVAASRRDPVGAKRHGYHAKRFEERSDSNLPGLAPEPYRPSWLKIEGFLDFPAVFGICYKANVDPV
jgi:hypothetical protein